MNFDEIQPDHSVGIHLIGWLFEHDILSLDDMITWAEEKILVNDPPPLWLIDVTMARNREDVMSAVGKGRNRSRNWSETEYDQLFERGKMQIALYYLQYLSGELKWIEFLKNSGTYSDGRNLENPDCSYYYMMMDDIEEQPALCNELEQRQVREIGETFSSTIDRLSLLLVQIADWRRQNDSALQIGE